MMVTFDTSLALLFVLLLVGVVVEQSEASFVAGMAGWRRTSGRLFLLDQHRTAASTKSGNSRTTIIGRPSTQLFANDNNKSKRAASKRKRRRKKPPAVPAQDPVKVSQPQEVEGVDEVEEEDVITKEDLATISDVARFEFQTDKELTMGVQDNVVNSGSNMAPETAVESTSNAIPLPDIKEARKKRLMEEELAKAEQEKEEQRVKIKRSDKEAFTKLLEQQPFADADDSFFEEEEYGTVSALLGEKAKPFLSIPFGPLQVGHFIGALGIVLMAFVEYPGFPLTNLPTPLRDCLQGGLGTVYAINTVLAVLAAFKAPERGQPVPLWAAKTFTVGGLAYHQLMQLPTLEEIERVKSVKGKRALKNRKKQ